MHLGMLTTGYPFANDPVSGAFVRAMARALVVRGHTVTVLCAEHPTDAPVRDPGITVHPVRYQPVRAWQTLFHGAGAPDRLTTRDPHAWSGALAYPIALVPAAYRRLARCDALISHFALPCAAAAGVISHGRPHLAIAHGTDARWLARMPAWVQRAVVHGATSVQFTHAAALAAMAPSVRDDPRVFVRAMGFDPCSARSVTGEYPVLVLAVARLVPVKGLDVLVEAARQLPAHVAVVIVGDGPMMASLRGRAPDSVRFVGACTPLERDRWLAQATLFVAPARRLGDGRTESAPVAVIEALGAGLPVIHTGVGALETLVGDAGWRVPPDDAHALALAITHALRNADDRTARAARARARVQALRWDVQSLAIERLLTVARSASPTAATIGTP